MQRGLSLVSLLRSITGKAKDSRENLDRLGIRVGDYPRSAIYKFKRILDGADAFLWDIGYSSLPTPAVVALPGDSTSFLTKLQSILIP